MNKSNSALMQQLKAIVLASIAVVTFTLGMIPFKLVAKMKNNQDHQSQARYFIICFVDPDYLSVLTEVQVYHILGILSAS